MERVAAEEGLRSEFLLQLHLTDEPTKHGFSPEELPEALALLDGFRHAVARGFMAMAPLEGGREAARPAAPEHVKLACAALSRVMELEGQPLGPPRSTAFSS